MSSSNHFMVPSSSTDPMYQQMNQPDTRVQFQEQPVSQNTSVSSTLWNPLKNNCFRIVAPDASQFNAPIAPEANHTYHHQYPPVALQDPFQAQNLQKHHWNQENRFQQLDHVHGTFHPQNLECNQENWHHQYFMHENHQNYQSSSSHFHYQRNMVIDLQDHQFPQNPQGAQKNREIPGNYMNHQMFHQPAPDAVRNAFNPDFMNTNNQSMNPQMSHQLAHTAPKDQPGPSSFQQIPDNYMNYQLLHQPVTNTGKNQDLKNFNNQFMYPPKSHQHTHGTPGPSYLQGTPTNFQFGQMDQKNTAPNQFMNQMPPHLAFGNHGTPNYVALPPQNYGFPAPGQSPIVFNLLNAATWKFLSTFPNEMMVTNDGRSIFPRFEIGIMNLIPKAHYNVGIKLHLVKPQKYTYNVNEKKWREVARRKSEELAEQETNEVYSEVQSGQDIMDNGLKMKLVNIYTIGNEKKKKSAISGPMTEERMRMMEHKKKIRSQKMIRVFSQQKYVPIFTLYQQMDFGIPQRIATTQFPDTEFITTTGYRNETLKNWKRNNNEFVRGDLRNLDI